MTVIRELRKTRIILMSFAEKSTLNVHSLFMQSTWNWEKFSTNHVLYHDWNISEQRFSVAPYQEHRLRQSVSWASCLIVSTGISDLQLYYEVFSLVNVYLKIFLTISIDFINHINNIPFRFELSIHPVLWSDTAISWQQWKRNSRNHLTAHSWAGHRSRERERMLVSSFSQLHLIIIWSKW